LDKPQWFNSGLGDISVFVGEKKKRDCFFLADSFKENKEITYLLREFFKSADNLSV